MAVKLHINERKVLFYINQLVNFDLKKMLYEQKEGTKLKKIGIILCILALVVFGVTGCTKPSDVDGEKAKADANASSEEKVDKEGEKTDKQEEASEEKVLNFNLGADPKTIDPSLNSAIDGSHVINNLFEGLMRELSGKLTPAIAKEYKISEDGLVYTFTLRDAQWSDGKPVTAQDFEYGWKRVLNPKTGAPYSSHMYYIKNAQNYYEGKSTLEEVGIKAKDEKTFEVTLEAPTPYFLSLITRPAFMPLRKDIIEKGDEQWFFKKETAISNGPFILESYASGDKIILKKNENYWAADKVKIDKINMLMIIESSTSLTAFQGNDLDITEKMPKQEIPRLMSEDDRFYILPKMGTYYLQFNMNVKPLDDVRVRKALSLVINRRSIAEDVQKGGEIPATGFNPRGLLDSQGNDFHDKAGDYGISIDGDVKTAKALLAEAGFPEGKGFPQLTALYNTSESHKAVFEVIQEIWKKELGIDIKLENQEWAVFQSNRVAHNFEIARGGYIGDYPDPVGLLELLTEDSQNNHPDWKNKEFNDLIEKSRYEKGVERDNMIYKAQEILMKDMPIAPLFYYTDPVLVSDKITGWEKNSMSYWYFGNVDKTE